MTSSPFATSALPPQPQPTIQQLLDEGKRQHQAGNVPGAQHFYQQVLMRQPDHPEALQMLGLLAILNNQAEVAVDLFGRVLAMAPKDMMLRMRLAQALQKAGRGEDAVALADSMVRDAAEAGEKVNQSMAHYTRAVVLHALGRDEEAIVDALRAEALHPTGHDELLLLPTIFLALGRFQEARDAAQRGINAHPMRGEHHWNLALTALLLGDFAAGWPAFQWRLKTPLLRHLAPPGGKTLWEGQDLKGKSICIYREGGFGDAIQFVRYVPQLAKRGAKKVILTAPQELYELFKCVPVNHLLIQQGPIPECDFICPLQSLPLNFQTTLETIPREVPYLRADPQKSRAWGARMTGEEMKVGLCWSGSLGNLERRTRSLRTFAPLADVQGVMFYGLQKGAESWQALIAPDGMKLINLMPEARDFADVAAIIDNLDLVISVDTSIPHLAGALGKPVWTLVPSIPDFRWMIEREDSPWYPTMRLFRQKTAKVWDDVMARVKRELESMRDVRG
jgi:tetratricopeptide (TPR) repeat protein